MSPHVFRKTVATVLSGQGLVTEAAAQLGHADESTTRKFYVQMPSTAPDVSHALEILIRADELSIEPAAEPSQHLETTDYTE